MVKSPRIRHSKPRRDPVTIDLDASEAPKNPARPAGDQPQAAKPDGAPDTMKTEAPTTASPAKPSAMPATPDRAAAPTAKGSDRPAAGSPGKPAPAKPSPAASAPGAQPFGRDAGKASASTPPPPPQQRPGPRDEAPPRRLGASGIMAGLVGAVVALLGAGAMQLAGILPSPSGGDAPAQVAALQDEIASLRQRVEAQPADSAAPTELAGRVDALAAELDAARAELAANTGSADPSAAQALNDRIAALEASVAALPRDGANAAPVDLGPVEDRIAALETSVADAASAAADAAAAAQAAGERIGQVEQSVSGLSARLDEQAEQPQAALAIAASALKAAIDRGEPFTTELDTFAAVAPDAAGIEPLRPMAAAGVPARTDIAAAFDAAATAMLAAGRTADPDAGLFDRLVSSAQSLVQVRPVGEVTGEGAPAVVARMEVAIDKGDYAAALAEYETLPEASRAAGADYAGKLRARLAADELMDKVLAAALKA